MLIRKQTNYDEFHCIAGECPKSCCIGWQIPIDETSLNMYKKIKGKFSDKLTSCIDFSAGTFKQNAARCALLNQHGLCDLQISQGEAALCDTCRIYPRYIGEYLNIREYTLSLSCPEATRMLLNNDYDFSILENEDNVLDNPEEFIDFDRQIFEQIDYARNIMLEIAANQNISLQDRLDEIRKISFISQRIFDGTDDSTCELYTLDYDYMTNSFDTLLKLEILEKSWLETINSTKDFWNKHDATSHEWKEAMYPDVNASFAFEKIFKLLLFTYLGGAVYDGQIYARTMIAIQSIRWIMMITPIIGNLETCTYLYSREIEHSDININMLISYFEKELD
ncbi:MAG: flagellin lysine-N-methylase [Eubacterium sp.]|nr:flagellin lysine-N-methylase [Eubacterium sp.]